MFEYFLLDSINAFHEQYPQVKLELLTDFTAKTIQNLKIDRCDVGFLNLPIEEDKSIILTDTVLLLNDIFIAGGQFAELKHKKISIWDLQKYPLILMRDHTVSRGLFDRFCQSLGMRLVPMVEVDSWSFMKRLVADGMGIGCIPREYARKGLENGRLTELEVSPALPSRSVGMAVSKDTNMSFALRSFISLVRKKKQ